MSAIFNLNEISNQLNNESWEQEDDNNYESRRLYLGTVFNLVPSGKYYQPFACSNVNLLDEYLDNCWYKQAELELSKINCSLESGEGSASDLFAVEYRQINKV